MNVIYGVVVRFFKNRGLHRSDNTGGVTNIQIEVRKRTVVGTTHNEVGVLGVESHAGQRRWGLQGDVGEVRVLEGPNIRLSWHVVGHLLETQQSIGDTNGVDGGVRMPVD